MHVLYIPCRNIVLKDICGISAGVNKHFCCVAFHGLCTFLIKEDRLSTRMRQTGAVGFGAKWPLTETQLLWCPLRSRIVSANHFLQLSDITGHYVFKKYMYTNSNILLRLIQLIEVWGVHPVYSCLETRQCNWPHKEEGKGKIYEFPTNGSCCFLIRWLKPESPLVNI